MRKWTKEEVRLFNAGLSDKEIAERTGRTLKAVKMKKSRLVENPRDYPKETPGELMNETTKLSRIYALCKKLGVKLFG